MHSCTHKLDDHVSIWNIYIYIYICIYVYIWASEKNSFSTSWPAGLTVIHLHESCFYFLQSCFFPSCQSCILHVNHVSLPHESCLFLLNSCLLQIASSNDKDYHVRSTRISYLSAHIQECWAQAIESTKIIHLSIRPDSRTYHNRASLLNYKQASRDQRIHGNGFWVVSYSSLYGEDGGDVRTCENTSIVGIYLSFHILIMCSLLCSRSCSPSLSLSLSLSFLQQPSILHSFQCFGSISVCCSIFCHINVAVTLTCLLWSLFFYLSCQLGGLSWESSLLRWFVWALSSFLSG